MNLITPSVLPSAVLNFCAKCGHNIETLSWPKKCPQCGQEHYHPIPNVGVAVLEHEEHGPLLIRRGIKPYLNKWAFPGGFQDFGEPWEKTAPREVSEELSVDLSDVLARDPIRVERHLISMQTNPVGQNVFFVRIAIEDHHLQQIRPSREAPEWRFARPDDTLEMTTHNHVLQTLMAKRAARLRRSA